MPLAAKEDGLGVAELCGALRARRLLQGLWWLQGCRRVLVAAAVSSHLAACYLLAASILPSKPAITLEFFRFCGNAIN